VKDFLEAKKKAPEADLELIDAQKEYLAEALTNKMITKDQHAKAVEEIETFVPNLCLYGFCFRLVDLSLSFGRGKFRLRRAWIIRKSAGFVVSEFWGRTAIFIWFLHGVLTLRVFGAESPGNPR
jgi:hypothetical protein